MRRLSVSLLIVVLVSTIGLGDAATAAERIKTIRGKGYMLAPDAW